MNILYTILGTYNSGGMERVLANKANYLAKLGYTVTIVTTDQRDKKPYFELDSSIILIDLKINYTDDLDKGILSRGISYFKKQKLHRKKLTEILFKVKPEITVSMFDNDASFITHIADGSKKVLEIHFSRFKRLQYGRKGIWKLIDTYRNKSDLKTVKKFDRFIVLTEEDKAYWGSLPNIEVIPNANSFTSSTQASLTNNSVLAIGRFDYQKGFDDLIKIWQIVQQSNPKWKLNIYGHGPLENDLKKLISSCNLNDSIVLRSPIKDIKSVYLDHSILVMTSRYEGLPMVLLEGQVCGLPLVSYACKCGPKDIITDGSNGYIIDEGDKSQFASRLVSLMNNDSTRKTMGNNSLKNSENFTESKVMYKWIELFENLI